MILTKDEDCYMCYGNGIRYDEKCEERIKCLTCCGTGKQLTEIGQEIIQFFRDHKEAIFDGN